MVENKVRSTYQNVFKSKFIRSVFWQIFLIFLIVMIAVITIVFISFTSEIKNNTIEEKREYLSSIEKTISSRMSEVISISYNIGNDKLFYFNNVSEKEYSGYEMSNTLGRYLVGNDFIEHLAYYRLSEPEVIYASSGEISFMDFWKTYMRMDDEQATYCIESIQRIKEVTIKPFYNEDGKNIYIAYVYPLPEFSQNPQAFVLAMFPTAKVDNIVKNQLSSCLGEVMIYDAQGSELYCYSNLDEKIPISPEDLDEETFITYNKYEYVMHKIVSETNGWTYVSVVRMDDMISEVASKQLSFITILLVITVVAVAAMFFVIMIQYKPINNLAMAVSEDEMVEGKKRHEVIDEQSLLADRYAVLKDDSEQKQKFEDAYHEADAANKAKSAFLSNMSHDIRTPMNAIVGMTEIASKNLNDPDYVRECLQNVRVSSQYLLDIINNVLDMSRIESGKLVLSNGIVDISRITHDILSIVNHSLEVKSLSMKVEVDNILNEKFIGDQIRIEQIFMNILSNSIKFTPNGGEIRFYMKQEPSTEEGYGDYLFVISDNGIGMSKEFVKKVFETFTRDSKVSVTKTEGTGLGMSIAKSFVELMGGTIQCESEIGKGTTFTVRMHFKLTSDSFEFDSQKYRNSGVLIIGSDQELCNNQMNLFNSLGVRTKRTDDVTGAIEIAKEALKKEAPFDYIIMNQQSDDRNGIRSVTSLIEHIGTSASFVLAVQDLLSIEKSNAVDAGVSAFVQIPIFRSSAISILNKTCKRQDVFDSEDVIDLTGRRILLVEDNAINREIAHKLLEETNAEIVEATNGREAVDRFKESHVNDFDVILMDVQMPLMSGYEATAAIRSIQRPDAMTVPIYAMTANTFDEDVRQVKEAGMNGHLGKPYVSAELYRLLKEAIGEVEKTS